MKRLFGLIVLLSFCFVAQAAEKKFHPQAHSHNDYLQARPLLDALDQGFCGVEADIYLVDGELRVAHDLEKAQPGRTLEKLYLAPLRERVEKNGGSVYPNGPSLLLLIDIKTNALEVYPVLRQQLRKYESMLSHVTEDKIYTNAVTVVLSGERPRKLIEQEKKRFAFYDGRFENLGDGSRPSFMPLVSDNWKKHFAWKGEGPISEVDQMVLHAFVKKVHDEGKQIRFWGAPDHPEAWEILRRAGVDWINTDHLKPLAGYLLKSEK